MTPSATEVPPERTVSHGGRLGRFSRRRVVGAVALLAVLVLLAVGVRWWTHPTLFPSLGDSSTLVSRPVGRAAFATTVIFPTVGGGTEVVRITGLEARFRETSAAAEVTFAICHPSAGDRSIGTVRDADRNCRDLERFEPGAALRHGPEPGGDYLVAIVTPTEPGVVHLRSVEVTYERGASHLWQRGTQELRVDRKVRAL